MPNTEKILRLKTQQRDKIAKSTELIDRAELEKRGLSRRERAELATTEQDLERLATEIRQAGGDFDPRLTQGTSRDGEETDSVALRPEQRMTDWLADKGRNTLPAGFEELGDGERFSVGRMVRGACTGEWEGAELERRALAEGTLGTGGYLVPTPLAGTMIDRVRNAAQIFTAGALTVPMEAPTLKLARLATAGASVGWHAENTTINPSGMSFEGLTLTAQTLPIIVTISLELFEDLSPAASSLIEHEMAAALSLELDRACLRGSGAAPELRGIRNSSGITVTSLGANGASLTWDPVIDSVTTVRNLNIEPGAIIAASRSWGTLNKLKLTTGEYFPIPPSLAGIKRLSSNQLPVNLTQGSANNASDLYTGAFENLLVGIRTDLRFDVRVLDQRYIDQGQYGLLCYLRADCVLAHPEAFCVTTGLLP